MKRFSFLVLLTLVCGLLLTLGDARACAVCNGEDGSAMTEGAKVAVILLGSVTYVLLTGVAVIVGFWIVRARRLAREQEEVLPSSSSNG